MSKRLTKEKSVKSRIAIATELIRKKSVVPDFIFLFPLIISLFFCNNLFNFTSLELKIFIAILTENLKFKGCRKRRSKWEIK